MLLSRFPGSKTIKPLKDNMLMLSRHEITGFSPKTLGNRHPTPATTFCTARQHLRPSGLAAGHPWGHPGLRGPSLERFGDICQGPLPALKRLSCANEAMTPTCCGAGGCKGTELNTELLRGGGQHQAEGLFDPCGCSGSPL